MCHGTRGGTIRSEQTASPERPVSCLLCFALLHVVHTCKQQITCFRSFGSSGQQHLRDRKGGECVVAVSRPIAAGARHDLPTDCYLTLRLPRCFACPAALLLTCPIRAFKSSCKAVDDSISTIAPDTGRSAAGPERRSPRTVGWTGSARKPFLRSERAFL